MKATARSPRDEQILSVPLNQHLGLVFDGREGDTAFAHFLAVPHCCAFGGVHAGVLYALMDATSLLALVPFLEPSQHAVSCDLHVQYMRPVLEGARCDLHARILRRGRTLAFMDVIAEVEGKPVAAGHVTKSMVPVPALMQGSATRAE